MESVSLNKYKAANYELTKQSSVGRDLQQIEFARAVKSDPTDNKYRRTIILTKINNSWGFTLQTYGIHHKKSKELEIMTYVDYVEKEGSAHKAGMRQGDVILSVNGYDMTKVDHDTLVTFIKTKCDKTMRMVVMFEDCCHKVNLHIRYIKLKNVVRDKVYEYRLLHEEERKLLESIKQRQAKVTNNPVNSVDKIITNTSEELPDIDINYHSTGTTATVQYSAFTHSSSAKNTKPSVLEGTIVHVEVPLPEEIESSSNSTGLYPEDSPYIGGRIVRDHSPYREGRKITNGLDSGGSPIQEVAINECRPTSLSDIDVHIGDMCNITETTPVPFLDISNTDKTIEDEEYLTDSLTDSEDESTHL